MQDLLIQPSNKPDLLPKAAPAPYMPPQEIADKFILDSRPVYQWFPQEQAEIAKSILSSLQPEQANNVDYKTRNVMYMSSLFDITPEQAYMLHDALAKEMFNKENSRPIQVLNDIKNHEIKRKEILKAVWDGFDIAGNGMVQSLAGNTMATSEKSLGDWRQKLMEYAGFKIPYDIRPKLVQWSKDMDKAAKVYLEEHPERAQQIIPQAGFMGTARQYLERPENIIQGAVESSPLLLEAALGSMTGTHAAKVAGWGAKLLPWMGRVFGMSQHIMGSKYGELRDLGVPPNIALPQAFLTATGEGIIEEWTLGKKVDVFKGVIGQGVKKGLSTTAAQILLVAPVRGAAEEGTQRMNENFWNMIFSDPDQKIFEGVPEEAAAGGFVEMAMTGGFAAAGKSVAMVMPKSIVERARGVKEILDEVQAEPEHKQEMTDELAKVVIEKITGEKIDNVQDIGLTADEVMSLEAEEIEETVQEVKASKKQAAEDMKAFLEKQKEAGAQAATPQAAPIEKEVYLKPLNELSENEAIRLGKLPASYAIINGNKGEILTFTVADEETGYPKPISNLSKEQSKRWSESYEIGGREGHQIRSDILGELVKENNLENVVISFLNRAKSILSSPSSSSGEQAAPVKSKGKGWSISESGNEMFFDIPGEEKTKAGIEIVPGPDGQGAYIAVISNTEFSFGENGELIRHKRYGQNNGPFRKSQEQAEQDLKQMLENGGLPSIGVSKLSPKLGYGGSWSEGALEKQPGYDPETNILNKYEINKIGKMLSETQKQIQTNDMGLKKPLFGESKPEFGQWITEEDVELIPELIKKYGDFDIILKWDRRDRQRIKASDYYKHHQEIVADAEVKTGDSLREVYVAESELSSPSSGQGQTTAAGPVLKQPWEMTRKEYQKSLEATKESLKEARNAVDEIGSFVHAGEKIVSREKDAYVYVNKNGKEYNFDIIKTENTPKGFPSPQRTRYLAVSPDSDVPLAGIVYRNDMGKVVAAYNNEGKIGIVQELYKRLYQDWGNVTGAKPVSKQGANSLHRFAVQQALSEGKPVPAEVLAEYPELTKQPASAVIPSKPKKKYSTRDISEINKQILANEAYQMLEGQNVRWAETINPNPKNPLKIAPEDWGEVRDAIGENKTLKDSFIEGKKGDPSNYKIDEWAIENFHRTEDYERNYGQGEKIPGQEDTNSVDLFTQAIRAWKEYNKIKKAKGEKINQQSLKDAIKSNHPDAIALEWIVRKRDLIYQGFSKEQIEYAEKQYWNQFEGQSDVEQAGKTGSNKSVKPAGQNTWQDEEYEALEREALQSEQELSDADIDNFFKDIPPEAPKGNKEAGFVNVEPLIEMAEEHKRKLSNAWDSFKKLFADTFEKISFRLENISTKLMNAVRWHAFEKTTSTYKSLERIKPFKEKMDRLWWKNRNDWETLDFVLKKNDWNEIVKLRDKHNLGEELAEVLDMLKDIYDRAELAGIKMDLRQGYYPRRVKDMKWFLEIAYKIPGLERSVIEDAFKAKAKHLGIKVEDLTEEQKVDIINSQLRGYQTAGVVIGRPGHAKERAVEEYTKELDKAYYSAADGLVRYVEEMESAIALYNFFGRLSPEIRKVRTQFISARNRISALKKLLNTTKTIEAHETIRKKLQTAQSRYNEKRQAYLDTPLPDRQPSIGDITSELLAKGEIRPGQDKELQQILKAYFNPGVQNIFVSKAMQIGYLGALGNSIFHNITQLGEISNAILESWRDVIPAAYLVAIREEIVKHSDVPHKLFSEELNFQGGLGAFVNHVLRITLGTDDIGKALHRNTAALKAIRLAAENNPSFIEELKLYFGDTWQKALNDIKAGEVNESLLFYVYNKVSDRQPYSGAEMPTLYHTSPNIARPFLYNLRSFQLNRINSIIQNTRRDIRNGHYAKAVATLAVTLAVYLSFDMATDVIKDMIRGKKIEEDDYDDYVLDNSLRMLLMSKYLVKSFEYKLPSEVVMQSFTPPFLGVFDDAVKSYRKDDPKYLEKYIPIVGYDMYIADKKGGGGSVPMPAGG